jgi:glycosyltransferase involved in cell wall biosynthesis
LYYSWSSNARGKASGNLYQKLGYDLQIFCTKEKNFPKFRKENKAKIWCGIKKYMGDSLAAYLFFHFVFIIQSSLWLLTRCIIERPKILHVHNMPDYLMLTSLIGKIFGLKIIWDIRDITPVLWSTKKNPNNNSSNSNNFYHFILKIQNLFSKPAEVILCADHFQKEFLVKNGIPEKKIKVFMNLPLEENFTWIGTPKEKNPFILVYHGTITHRLGLDLAISAISLVKHNINVNFKIVGDGDQVQDLIKLIRDLKIEDNVNILNKMIPNEKIPEWVKGANGAIIPNRKTLATDNYMLPHKMLEYIKLGIPVIAPKLKIIQHYFRDTQAIFFEPDNIEDLSNAINKLHNINGEDLARNAYDFFKINSYDKNLKIIESLVL